MYIVITHCICGLQRRASSGGRPISKERQQREKQHMKKLRAPRPSHTDNNSHTSQTESSDSRRLQGRRPLAGSTNITTQRGSFPSRAPPSPFWRSAREEECASHQVCWREKREARKRKRREREMRAEEMREISPRTLPQRKSSPSLAHPRLTVFPGTAARCNRDTTVRCPSVDCGRPRRSL